MNADSGFFDRRIWIEVAVEAKDVAGDPQQTWPDDQRFKLWANKSDNRGREFFGASQLIRDADTVFTIRASSEAAAIAPESHRVVYDGRIYEIVAISEGKERKDTLVLVTTTRPDNRGTRAREVACGEKKQFPSANGNQGLPGPRAGAERAR